MATKPAVVDPAVAEKVDQEVQEVAALVVAVVLPMPEVTDLVVLTLNHRIQPGSPFRFTWFAVNWACALALAKWCSLCPKLEPQAQVPKPLSSFHLS